MLLQSYNKNFRVRFDNLKIQRPLPASQHFNSADWPVTWQRSATNSAKIATDSRGQSYIFSTRAETEVLS